MGINGPELTLEPIMKFSMKFTHVLRPMALAVSCIVVSGCEVTPVKQVETRAAIPLQAGVGTRPIAFQKIVTKLPLGEKIGTRQYGLACMPGAPVEWRGGRLNVTDEELADTFRKELKALHYTVVGDPYALFGDPDVAKTELVVAGLITAAEINACFPFSGSPNVDIGNTNRLKGGAFMRVTWQVFGTVEGKVVYETTTEGAFQTAEVIGGGFPIILRNAFAENVKNLLADKGFHALVQKANAPKPAEKATGRQI